MALEQLTQHAMDYYRQEGCKETTIRDGKTVLFRRKGERVYCYPVNDITLLQPKDYFLIEDGPASSLHEWVDLDGLNEVLKCLDPKLFLTVNQIIVLTNQEEIEACDEYIKRRVKRTPLGLHTYDKNHVIVNLYQIIKGARKITRDPGEFAYTVIYQFYTTLIHELGHVTRRQNGLGIEFCAIEDDSDEEDEEMIVEEYAEMIFEELDETMDVFKPFNYERIERYYKNC